MSRKSLRSRPIIFVSFASADDLLATEFRNRLQRIVGDEVNCFLAPKSIDTGENWPAQIEKYLSGASCIVILVSDSALHSTWVLFEAGVGRGRGAAVIPVALAGYNIDRQQPPLSFLQTAIVSTVDDLNRVLERIEKALKSNFDKKFTPADLVAIVDKAVWQSDRSKTTPLLSRRAVFEEAAQLVRRCHINSVIRGASSLVATKDLPDQYMRLFDDAIRKKFSAAMSEGGRIRYEVVLGIHRDAGNALSRDAKTAIIRRMSVFRDIGALSRLTMRENSDAWSMNVLLVNDSDAILAFPEGGLRLRCGLKITGSALVAPISRWYENSLKKHAKLIRRSDYE